jgi:peroxiredoxin
VKRLREGLEQMGGQLPCVLLSDETGEAIKPLQLQHTSFAKVGKMMAVPGNILVDKEGKVVWAYYSNVAMDRPDPKVVLEKAKAL